MGLFGTPRERSRKTSPVLVLVGLVVLFGSRVAAYESDQYSHRHVEIEDAGTALDAQVNEALQGIAAAWRGPADERRFARRVYSRLGGRHWVDRLERWANRSERIERLPEDGRRGIYGGLPFWATRVVSVVGVGPTIQVHGTLVGTDKIGHFLSQGWKYHKRHLRGLDEAAVVRLGSRNEAGIFGLPFTGTYSNADLVANYEGYRFYRSLFAPDPRTGKAAIVAWSGDGARIRRPFTFVDHVNDYWDEAVNPNRYDRLLRGRMRVRLAELCDDYRRSPEAWTAAEAEALEERYEHLRLRDATALRLDVLCAGGARPKMTAALSAD